LDSTVRTVQCKHRGGTPVRYNADKGKWEEQGEHETWDEDEASTKLVRLRVKDKGSKEKVFVTAELPFAALKDEQAERASAEESKKEDKAKKAKKEDKIGDFYFYECPDCNKRSYCLKSKTGIVVRENKFACLEPECKSRNSVSFAR